METHFTEKDRATLTTVEVKLDRAIQDIASLTNSFATKEDVKDHELRIRRLELWGAIAIGGMYAIQFYFNYIK